MPALPDFSAHGYRAEALLGSNPEGGRTAYRGVRLADGAAVVVKRFSFAGDGASWDSYESHQRELGMLQGLKHPRIPAYLDDFQTADGFCLVQELCPAPPMAARRTWTPERVEALARSALELLAWLQDHTPPIIHRDLKPENILVDDDGQAFFVDFGLARADRAQATTIAVGTPGFVPPEQLLGHELTTATDLYGLGAALVSALTGTPSGQIGSLVDSAFSFDLSRLPDNVSEGFRAWLGRMVAPSLKERFGSAREALQALGEADAVLAKPEAEPKPKRSKAKPRKQKPPQQQAKRRSTSKATSKSSRGNQRVAVAMGMAMAIAAIGVGVIVGAQGSGSGASGANEVKQTISCKGPMTLTEDVVMKRQVALITAYDGCDLTAKGIELKGHIGLQVHGGKVTLEGVTLETASKGIDMEGADAEVVIRDSTLTCGWTCLENSAGRLTVTGSTVTAKKHPLTTASGKGAKAVVTDSTLTSKTETALWAYGGDVTLKRATLVGVKRSIDARRDARVTVEGGRLQGPITTAHTAQVTGLDSAELDLGDAAGETWARFGCAPILPCVEEVGALGEWISDVRLPLQADGTLGEPEFVQNKLDPKAEACIRERLAKVKVPAPDGQPHTLRCTANGNRMAGGGGMRSVDYKLEK